MLEWCNVRNTTMIGGSGGWWRRAQKSGLCRVQHDWTAFAQHRCNRRAAHLRDRAQKELPVGWTRRRARRDLRGRDRAARASWVAEAWLLRRLGRQMPSRCRMARRWPKRVGIRPWRPRETGLDHPPHPPPPPALHSSRPPRTGARPSLERYSSFFLQITSIFPEPLFVFIPLGSVFVMSMKGNS